MDFLVLLRRSLLVALTVAIGSLVAVVLLHDWYHLVLLPGLGIGNPWGDAIGTVLIIAVVFVGQHLISKAFYRDWLLGVTELQAMTELRVNGAIGAAEQVAGELKAVPGYNDVVRGRKGRLRHRQPPAGHR
jgi:methyl-accepting chemotaxis protein